MRPTPLTNMSKLASPVIIITFLFVAGAGPAKAKKV
jgi:hypothetical protein